LIDGGINLALMTRSLVGKRPKSERIMTQPLLLIVPPNHRLASRDVVRLADLANETSIGFPRGHAVRDMTDELCRNAGYVICRRYESSIRPRNATSASQRCALPLLRGNDPRALCTVRLENSATRNRKQMAPDEIEALTEFAHGIGGALAMLERAGTQGTRDDVILAELRAMRAEFGRA